MSQKLAWGIIGTGKIATLFAKGLAESKTGELVAVGSRAQNTADAFGKEFNISRCYSSYDALLADPVVQAVYISTPHPQHAEWAIKTAEAGKHILCEKPLTINHAEAMAVVEAAYRHNVFLMEAFMYRCHPQIAKLVELLRAKAIGDVKVIQATFSFKSKYDPESRLYNNALGGGGILDVGCYCASAARLIAGVAIGQDFAEPLEVRGTAHIGGEGRVDEYAIASLKFPGDIVAQLSTGVSVQQENIVRVFGTNGNLMLTSPWIPGRVGVPKIILRKDGQEEPQEILVEPYAGLYTLEADVVAAHLDKKQAPSPAMTWDDSLGNMKTLDQWRAAVGLVYDSEQPAAQTLPVSGRPLTIRKDHKMKYGRVPGVEKPVARLVMGVDNQFVMPYAAVMFDDYFERGGNCFDTAYIYGTGLCEKMLGQWIKNRNVREQVVILDKGAAAPFCNPEAMTRQLMESLDRLQTDYVDLYVLHRDNPDIPVGEFVDVLNEHKQAGRIRAFGGSNWTIERLAAANEYAATKGRTGFSVLSNQFSLARMVTPVWAGCLSASDAESRAWLMKTQMALMPWSSQGRGFFLDQVNPEYRSNEELVRSWYSQDNFRRLEHARELARKRGVLPINIALAYVLCQPFPTFPLIGPRTLAETRSSFHSLEVELSTEELRWLNLEDEPPP
jgi:predicted dehydrogenase/aryl-alcohol dehydrogenase-like predicted oxidoreductase